MAFSMSPIDRHATNLLREVSDDLTKAEALNVTYQFRESLKERLDRKRMKNIPLVITGPTRSGKTYVAISIGKLCADYIKKTYGEDKIINICKNESVFLDKIQDAKTQDIFIIDEKENTAVQEGSFAELAQMQDFDNICAAKGLIVIRIKPQEIMGTNALMTLFTHERDEENKLTKLLVKKVNALGQEIFIGHIIVDLKNMACEEMKQDNQRACYFCPFYKAEDETRCTHFLAEYERSKMENIDDFIAGRKTPRAQLILDLAHDFASHPEYKLMYKNTKARIAFLRNAVNDRTIFAHASNRQLTIGEIEQIDGMAKFVFEKEHDLIDTKKFDSVEG